MGGTVAFYGRRDLIAAAILQNLDMAEGVAQMLNHVWQGGIMLKN